MAIYFLLGKLSHEGQQMLHNNPDMVAETAASTNVEGAQILGQYAVLGSYDFITMVQAEENEPVARLSQELGVRTGLHFETLAGVTVGFLAENDSPGGVPDETAVELESGADG